jgi:hypothetical protein
MTETQPEVSVEGLVESARIMFVTINAIFSLHKPVDSDDVVICEHCSKVGAGTEIVYYPCPTASILLADMVVDDSTSETSEPAEAEQPSS